MGRDEFLDVAKKAGNRLAQLDISGQRDPDQWSNDRKSVCCVMSVLSSGA